MRYEVIREILNLCRGNQMRDVFVTEMETDDPDGVAMSFCTGENYTMEKQVKPDGSIIYDFTVDGLHQRLSFTPED